MSTHKGIIFAYARACAIDIVDFYVVNVNLASTNDHILNIFVVEVLELNYRSNILPNFKNMDWVYYASYYKQQHLREVVS